jgi:hypothetical protein
MALELLIAVPGSSRFRFDGSLLATLAPQIWPEVEQWTAQGQVADFIDRYVYLPTGYPRRCELAIHRGGGAIGITAPTDTVAADVIAWICAVSRPPAGADDTALLVNWARDPVPLRAHLTSVELLRLRSR